MSPAFICSSLPFMFVFSHCQNLQCSGIPGSSWECIHFRGGWSFCPSCCPDTGESTGCRPGKVGSSLFICIHALKNMLILIGNLTSIQFGEHTSLTDSSMRLLNLVGFGGSCGLICFWEFCQKQNPL